MGITTVHRAISPLKSEPSIQSQPSLPIRPARPNAGKRIQLPCPPRPLGVDLTSTPWREFRRRYEAQAKQAFAKSTFIYWASAADRLERILSLKVVSDLSPEALDVFEKRMQATGYLNDRIRGSLSRIHHAIIWGCDAGYFDAAVFGVRPPGVAKRWPARPHGYWDEVCSSQLRRAA